MKRIKEYIKKFSNCVVDDVENKLFRSILTTLVIIFVVGLIIFGSLLVIGILYLINPLIFVVFIVLWIIVWSCIE